jgi:predicted transcriptional regulator
METNYEKLLNGHGRVVCKICHKVLATCRCFNCGDNVIETICDICKIIAEDIKWAIELQSKVDEYFLAVTPEKLIEDLKKAGFDSESLKTIIEGMQPELP